GDPAWLPGPDRRRARPCRSRRPVTPARHGCRGGPSRVRLALRRTGGRGLGAGPSSRPPARPRRRERIDRDRPSPPRAPGPVALAGHLRPDRRPGRLRRLCAGARAGRGGRGLPGAGDRPPGRDSRAPPRRHHLGEPRGVAATQVPPSLSSSLLQPRPGPRRARRGRPPGPVLRRRRGCGQGPSVARGGRALAPGPADAGRLSRRDREGAGGPACAAGLVLRGSGRGGRPSVGGSARKRAGLGARSPDDWRPRRPAASRAGGRGRCRAVGMVSEFVLGSYVIIYKDRVMLSLKPKTKSDTTHWQTPRTGTCSTRCLIEVCALASGTLAMPAATGFKSI